MDVDTTYRFDPIDLEQMRLIRGRLHRRHPHLSQREINLKVLEEIERARGHHPW
jgi:hypothetical protein